MSVLGDGLVINCWYVIMASVGSRLFYCYVVA